MCAESASGSATRIANALPARRTFEDFMWPPGGVGKPPEDRSSSAVAPPAVDGARSRAHRDRQCGDHVLGGPRRRRGQPRERIARAEHALDVGARGRVETDELALEAVATPDAVGLGRL